MSDFIDALVDMLPEHNNLKKSNNELRRLLDISVGEWFDNRDITDFYSNLFLNSATGAYLDLFGVDYGVTRQVDESDEDYRTRIIQEKNDKLTPNYLQSVYGLKLYSYVNNFNVANNTLTSDNPYCTDFYMAIANDRIKNILNKKFILDNIIIWYSGGTVDGIFDVNDSNVLREYGDVYSCQNLSNYFKDTDTIKKVNLKLSQPGNAYQMFYDCDALTDITLSLPNINTCNNMLYGCDSLVNVDLDIPKAYAFSNFLRGCSSLVNLDLSLPKATVCNSLLYGCNSLKNLKLNLPILNSTGYTNFLDNCTSLEYIDLTIPNTIVSSMKNYISGLNLTNLQELKINGQVVSL